MRTKKERNILIIIVNLQYSENIYIVLEYCQGGELFDIVKNRGPFDDQAAKDFFSQILSAVDYMHKKLVCHRDLSLENILVCLTNFSWIFYLFDLVYRLVICFIYIYFCLIKVADENGTLKLADFGLARFMNRSAETGG